jgi:hypothetical protein
MHRRPTFIALSCSLAALAVTIGPAAASADTVVMGSPLASDFDSPGQSIAAPTLSAQLSFDPTTSPNPVVSPVNGVITGWKVKSADDGALYTLKVLRPNGPVSLVVASNSNFTAVASVAAPSPIPGGTAGTTPTGKIFDYPASLPINKGDYIGELATGAVSDIPQHTTGGVPKNLTSNNFAGQPADGAAANLMADEQHELLLQATIQFTPPSSPASPVKVKKCKKKAKKHSAKIAKKKCKKKKKKKK